jgi:hypothetical protein
VGSRDVLDAVVKRKIPSSRRKSNPRTAEYENRNLHKRVFHIKEYADHLEKASGNGDYI